MALSAQVAKAFGEIGQSGRVPALPKGTVVRGIITPKKDTTYIEKVQFAKSGRNAQVQAWNMRFVVPSDLQYGNRNFFARVPRAYFIQGDKGAIPAYLTLNLFKALGYTEETLNDDTPQKLTDRELIGRPVDLVLGVQDDFKWGEYLDGLAPEERQAEEQKALTNPLYKQVNTVAFINAPKPSTGKKTSGAPVAPGAGAGSYLPPADESDPWAADERTTADESDPWANFDPATSQL